MKEIVIPKDDAVFWMDANGSWRNRHGKFQHPKIIDYFNASIRRDDEGYYVTQIMDDVREKVYFHYDRTPLFVVDVVENAERLLLVLNTKSRMVLDPSDLFTAGDALFFRFGEKEDEIVKFTDRGMLKIAEFLKETPQGLEFVYQDRKYPIREVG